MADAEKRGQRTMDAPLLTYDIPELVRRLKQEETWKLSNRNSMTLNMGTGLRAVVVALHEGAELAPHRTEHPINIQAVEGEVMITSDAGEASLAAGQMLTLHKGVTHSVKAKKESAFLLTFGA